MMTFDIQSLIVSPRHNLQECIEALNQTGKGIVLVTDDARRLLDTITDGDIRRAILWGIPLDRPVSELLARRAKSPYPAPITAPLDADRDSLLNRMQARKIRHIPLLDDQNRIAGLALLEELLPEQALPVQAVILASGQARQLHPLVEDLPKPMLPVGNRPLLELTIRQLRQAGIRHVNLTTHYKSETIVRHFGDGHDYGMEIRYLDERQPLGDAGALSLLDTPAEPVLVINGDVVTHVNYRALLDFHREQQADMTVAVRQYEFNIPYGVVQTEGSAITQMEDKPTLHRFVNAGIYLINPELLASIPKGQPYAISAWINQLVADGRRVASFPLHEYWLDIHEYQDYQQVLADAERGILGDLSAAVTQLEPGAPPPQGFIPLCVPELSGNEWAYIKECLDTNWISSVGPFVDRFEEMVAAYAGVKYGVAASSGTAALHIALLVAGVQPNDEVLVSTLTFIAPTNAIRYVGAWPVFMDAEPDFWQMDVQKVADFLEKECTWREGALYNRGNGRRLKGIIPVHVLGHPVDMDPLLELSRKYNLVVIEDATESLGATYKGKMVGQLGDMACFSFNGNKIITTGGGGMLVTNREDWARRAKYLTTQAKDDPLEYVHKAIGYNYRLTNIQAALGCAQMEHLSDYVAAKRRFAAAYSQAFASLPGIAPMCMADWADSIYWMYTILVDETLYGLDSRALLRRLAQAQIQTRPLWQPMHRSPVMADCQAYRCDVADRLYRQALSLPSSVGLTDEQQQKVIETIRNLS